MHYYQHHIGDFIKDTSFLTNEEIGIYSKLIWLYYDTEQALPNSLFELSMKTNARDSQDVLQGLLEMFFIFSDNKWHHTRCDREIEHYHQQIGTASKAGKASAAKRALNKKSTVVEQPLELRSTEAQPTNNQQPLTINQEPLVKKQRGSRLPNKIENIQEWIDFCNKERPELIASDVYAQFRDYWISKPGAGGVKLDWFATWRNWVRNQSAPKGLTTFAQVKADVARTTVPENRDYEATQRRLEAEASIQRSGPSLEVLAKMAAIRKSAEQSQCPIFKQNAFLIRSRKASSIQSSSSRKP